MQMQNNRFTLLLCSLLFISGVISLETILDRNFGKKKTCLDGIENNVFFLTGSAYNILCDHLCYMNEFKNGDNLITLDIIGDLGLVFGYSMNTFTEPYSYIQVDFSFMNYQDRDLLSVDINGLTSQTFITTTTLSMYEDAPSVVCSNQIVKVYTASLTLNQKLTAGQDLSVKFANTNGQGHLLLLRSIKITKNCNLNCQTCLNDLSCSVCVDGYQKYEFASGPSVCEQVNVCTALNCFSCAKYGTQEVCLKCNSGFQFSASNDCIANTPSPATPCQANEYIDSGRCLQYSSIGYYQDRTDASLIPILSSQTNVQLTYKCPKGTLAIVLKQSNYQDFQCKCMFDKCISCSSLDSCATCITGYKFDQTSKSCLKLDYTNNSYDLVQTVTETGYLLEYVFDHDLNVEEGDLDVATFKIIITDTKEYTYILQGIKNNNTIQVVVTCNENVKNENVQLSITDTKFLDKNLIQQPTLEEPLKAYVQVSASDKKAAQNLKTAGTAIGKTVVSTLIPIAFFGNFYVLVNTIDLTGFLYYLLFINVRFPINIFQFYSIFKNFQFAFIPNFFAGMVGNGYTQQSPPQFMQQSTDSYFLNNSGQSLSIFLIIMGIYFAIKILVTVEIKYLQSYLKRAIYETWEFGGWFDAVWSIYIYILIGCMLQFYDFNCSDSSCTFNYFFHSLWVLITFSFPIFVTYIIIKNPNIKDDKYMRVKCSSLISGLKLFSSKEALINIKDEEQSHTPPQTNNLFPNLSQTQFSQSNLHISELKWHQKLTRKLSKFNMSILYFRKFLFSLIIVYLYQYSYLQIVLISLMNIVIASYYIVVQPLEKKYENFKNAASEFLLIAVQVIIALLVNDSKDQSESHRIKLGWIAIGLIAFVIVWHTLGIIYDFLFSIFEYFKELKQRRNRSKVSNIENHEEKKLDNDQSPTSQAKKRHSPQMQGGILAFHNVEELPGEDEDDQTENQSPLQSQRMKRAKFSQVQKQGSINNLDTFVETNISPDNSPKRKRMSRLSVTALNNQIQPEDQHASIYDIPNSNNQIMRAEDNRTNFNGKRFSKIRNILES